MKSEQLKELATLLGANIVRVADRAKIDDTLFTADCPAEQAQEAEQDPLVESIAISKRVGKPV